MKKPTTKQPMTHPPVTMHQMPDGSFRIYGLRNHSRIHLTKEMRPWRREDGSDGRIYYTAWSREEADIYAANYGLTILEPTAS